MKERLKKKLYSDIFTDMKVFQDEIFSEQPKRRHGRIRKLLKKEHPEFFGRNEMDFTYKQLKNMLKNLKF